MLCWLLIRAPVPWLNTIIIRTLAASSNDAPLDGSSSHLSYRSLQMQCFHALSLFLLAGYFWRDTMLLDTAASGRFWSLCSLWNFQNISADYGSLLKLQTLKLDLHILREYMREHITTLVIFMSLPLSSLFFLHNALLPWPLSENNVDLRRSELMQSIYYNNVNLIISRQ